MKEEIVYECPKCHKQYKKLGWYKKHSKKVHGFILPPITKKLFKSQDLNAIFNKIDMLEKKIDQLLTTPIITRKGYQRIYNDIDIRPISKQEIVNDASPEADLRKEMIGEFKGLLMKFNNDIKDTLKKLEEKDLTHDQKRRLKKYIYVDDRNIEQIL